MANNKILTGQEAREKITQGVNLIADTVGLTLGARGRLVGVDYGYEVKSIRDGVTIARSILPKDNGLRFATRTLIQAANKQVATVGDGTSVVVVLAQAIYNECMKNVAAGTNPMELVEGLEKGRDLLLEELKNQAITLKTKEEAIQIATISCQNAELGKQIGEIIFDLGEDGVVTTDESPTGKTYVEMQEGLQFENGYFSPAFITDDNRMEATVENARIFLTDKELNNINEFLPLIKQLETAKVTNLVFIASEIAEGGTMLGSLIVNKKLGNMNILAVKAPYAGGARKDFLDDIAILTGARVITIDSGERFESVTLDDLGKAQRVTSTEKATKIVADKDMVVQQKDAIKARVKALKTQIERAEGSDYQREKLKERYAKLQNGIAVVKVGAPVEIEMKNWMERADDAIKAVQASMREGYVPGGETIYLTLRKILFEPELAQTILYNALEKPFQKLLGNAGIKADRFIDNIKDGNGVDVTDGQLKNMKEAGILDPAAVARESLVNAVSVATILATTEALILPEEEEKKNA